MAPERGSDKHGAKLDDVLDGETRGMQNATRPTHTNEWRQPEPSGEDQPDADPVPHGEFVGGTPAGMSAADVADRSQVASYLGLGAFPGTGASLADKAAENQAPDDVLRLLRSLPADQEFRNVQEVWDALGGGTEQGRA